MPRSSRRLFLLGLAVAVPLLADDGLVAVACAVSLPSGLAWAAPRLLEPDLVVAAPFALALRAHGGPPPPRIFARSTGAPSIFLKLALWRLDRIRFNAIAMNWLSSFSFWLANSAIFALVSGSSRNFCMASRKAGSLNRPRPPRPPGPFCPLFPGPFCPLFPGSFGPLFLGGGAGPAAFMNSPKARPISR